MPRTKQTVNYKKELEIASKSMIMIHDPKLLIKLIIRMIVSKVKIQHAGMILYEPGKDSYVLNISRGETGFKIPVGFARFDKTHPIIRLFNEKEFKYLTTNKNAILTHDLNNLIWQESVINGDKEIRQTLYNFGDQMQMFNSVACVPSFYRDQLLAVLVLGDKKDGKKFTQEELDFFSALASDAAMAIRNAQLFDELKQESVKNRDLFIRTTIVLGSAIEAKDPYTHGHTERVTELCSAIARQMTNNGSANFSDSFYESLYIAGILHDIGKIGVPENILNKKGGLTTEEFEVMKGHSNHGAEILEPLSELSESLKGVKYHHERYDGKGYPDGLSGKDIPMIAAIITVADAFDAMTTDRPYRKGRKMSDAIEEIKRCLAVQFHPKPAKALIELYEMGAI